MTVILTPVNPPLMTVQPPGWPQPSGYAHAVVGRGTMVFVSGQIAVDDTGTVASAGLVAQVQQILRNIRQVLNEVGAGPERIAQMTWFVLDIDQYRAQLGELGAAYRQEFGTHYPAMTLVEVTALANPDAVVEIKAAAILPKIGARSADQPNTPLLWCPRVHA